MLDGARQFLLMLFNGSNDKREADKCSKHTIFDGNKLSALQDLRAPCQSAVFSPAVHAYVNCVPVAEMFRQCLLFAAVFGDMMNVVKHVEVRHAYIPALTRKHVFNQGALFFC